MSRIDAISEEQFHACGLVVEGVPKSVLTAYGAAVDMVRRAHPSPM